MTALTDTQTDIDTAAEAAAEAATRAHARVPGWDGILDPGERILWQGRPDQAFRIDSGDLAGAVFALFFSGFAVFWMVMASQMDAPFWMFGLIHFSVGLWIFAKSVFGPTLRRRKTWYTLTNRRAFIARETARKGKTLDSYPITRDTQISFRDGPPATIHFAREKRKTDKGRSYTVPIGFERIADGQNVLALLRQVQRRKADP